MLNLRSRFVRLALIMTALPALILFGLSEFALRRFDSQLTTELENQINDDIAALVEVYTQDGSRGLIEAINMRVKMTETERAPSFYDLANQDSGTLAGNFSNSAPSNIARANRLVKETQLRGGETLMVGRSLSAKREALRQLRTLFFKAIILCIILGLGVGILSAALFKRRLRAINDLCRSVASGDVTARLNADKAGDEISQLSLNINVMLSRIEGLISVRKRISDQVAHELRTPLTQLDTVLQQAASTAEDAAPIEMARQDIRDCVTLLDGLLDVSALEAQSGDMSDFEYCDLSDIAREMCEFYEALAFEKGQDFKQDLMPNCATYGDPRQLSRLIANLIDNAIKYTPRDGRITVRMTKEKTSIILSVCDSGPGIAPEKRQMVFTPFFRHKYSQSSKGHGLGLALVKAIADRHNARMKIEQASTDGGSCFTFQIESSPIK